MQKKPEKVILVFLFVMEARISCRALLDKGYDLQGMVTLKYFYWIFILLFLFIVVVLKNVIIKIETKT